MQYFSIILIATALIGNFAEKSKLNINKKSTIQVVRGYLLEKEVQLNCYFLLLKEIL